MGIDDIRISFDQVPVNGFMPGTNILGKVILKVGKHKHIKDLNISLQGKATVKFHTHEVRWFPHHCRTKGSFGFPATDPLDLLNKIDFVRRLSDSSCFTAKQYFANTFHSLIGDSHLARGENVFPFCLPLMENLPPSFVCEYGCIRYKLKVRKKNHTLFKTEFRLNNGDACKSITHLDPAMNMPVTYKESMDFRQYLLSKKLISFSLSLPKLHFHSEEKLNAVLEINNTLSVKIANVIVNLGVVILCAGKHNGHKNVKRQHDVICEVSCGSMKQGEIKSWTIPFLVPNPSVSSLDCCSIIRAYHAISVTIKPDCLFSDMRSMHFFAPIQISPLPLSTEPLPQSNIASTSSSSSQPIGFIFQPSFAASAPQFPDDSDPPPPYPGTPPAIANEINRLRLS